MGKVFITCQVCFDKSLSDFWGLKGVKKPPLIGGLSSYYRNISGALSSVHVPRDEVDELRE